MDCWLHPRFCRPRHQRKFVAFAFDQGREAGDLQRCVTCVVNEGSWKAPYVENFTRRHFFPGAGVRCGAKFGRKNPICRLRAGARTTGASLERDVFAASAPGTFRAVAADGLTFLDIGTPESFAEAEHVIARALGRRGTARSVA